MTDLEERIVTAYIGRPDQEDCSTDAVPDSALSGGKKTILMPQVISMTKYLFANYRLKMYSYLNHSLRTGVLRSIIGFHFTNKVLNKESCCFPSVSFWRIDRTSFWADVEVALCLNTVSGSHEWRGVLSLWCSFDDVFSCSIEELRESCDRRAEGYDSLSPFLIPYFTNKRVDEVAEDLWMQYRPEALAIPALRDPEKLAALMGLEVQYYPLYDCKGIGGIIFFANGDLTVREEQPGFEAEVPRTIQIKANTIVVNTNAVRRSYAAFDIFHECFHYEYHYLFFRLQEMYNSDLRRIKTVEIEINQEKELSDPVYFMEKQATRGAYGLLLPASSTQERIISACNGVTRCRHSGEI